MLLLLIRHGHYAGNNPVYTEYTERYQQPSQPDWENLQTLGLSARGVKQARKLVPQLADLQIDAIYSSPKPRARETAEILAAGRAGLDVYYWDELQEIPPVTFPGAPEDYVWDGKKHYQTAKKIERKLRAAHGDTDETVVVVTHGNLMATLYSSLFNLKPCDYNRFTGFENCGVYRLILKNPDTVQIIMS